MNPADACVMDLFPTYPWNFEAERIQMCKPFFRVVPGNYNWRRFRNLTPASHGNGWSFGLTFKLKLVHTFGWPQLVKLVPKSMLKRLRTFSHQLLVGWRRFVAPLLL